MRHMGKENEVRCRRPAADIALPVESQAPSLQKEHAMRGTSTNAIRQPCGKPRLRGAHGAKTVRYDYVAWILGYVCIASPATAVGATFQGLGDLPGGSFASVAFAVSPDGSSVVGESGSSFGTEAFLWESGMMTGLGDLPGAGFFSTGRGVSLGGTVVVGYSLSAAALGASPPWEAFRWESGVMTGLGDPQEGTSLVGHPTSRRMVRLWSALERFR